MPAFQSLFMMLGQVFALVALIIQVYVDNRTVIVSGKPYVWRSVYDDELYGDYSAKIVLDQDVDTGDMRIELTIFDGDGDQLCTSRKPVIMYN